MKTLTLLFIKILINVLKSIEHQVECEDKVYYYNLTNEFFDDFFLFFSVMGGFNIVRNDRIFGQISYPISFDIQLIVPLALPISRFYNNS